MKVYDCFQFHNELDILEIRLETLYDVVDHFVITEMSKTHSNNPKKMYFEENKHLFEKYQDKIINVVMDYPEDILWFKMKDETSKENIMYNKIGQIYHNDNENDLRSWPTFCRDYLQREFNKIGLVNCDDDDIILVSDLDEIPRKEVVKLIRDKQLVNHTVMIDCYYYYINMLASTNSFGTYAVRFSETKDVALTHLRNRCRKFERIYNGGWHLSYMGGVDRVLTKMLNTAHQEYNYEAILSQIPNKIASGTDIINRPPGTVHTNGNVEVSYYDGFKIVDLNETYPEEMITFIKNKFPYLIKSN